MNHEIDMTSTDIELRSVRRDRQLMMGFLIFVCCILFLLADVATPTMFSEPIPGLIFLNIVVAQLTMICVWGTLVRGTLWIRLPWTLLLLVVSWEALSYGLQLERGFSATGALGLGLAWIYGFVVSFVPLKIAGFVFRWQIIRPDEMELVGRREQYALRDVMIGMSLLAVAMALGRAMFPEESITWSEVVNASVFGEHEGIVIMFIYAVASLIIKMPCIWIALAAPTEKILQYSIMWAFYCMVVSVLEVVLFISILGGGGPEGEIFIGFILGHETMGSIVLGVMLLLRFSGYRMECGLGR